MFKIGLQNIQDNQKDRKQMSRKIQRNQNPDKVNEDQRKWQTKCRLVDTDKKRLYNFRKNTMLNAIFTCLCCQRNLFECNVIKFTTELLAQIETKKPGIYARSIELFPITVDENNTEESN